MPKKPMTLLDVADKLGVHYMTVYRYVRTGKTPRHARRAAPGRSTPTTWLS